MNALTSDERASYKASGFVVVEDLFDPADMQDFKQHAIETCLDPHTPAKNVKWNAQVEAGAVEKSGKDALHAFWRPHTISEKYRALCLGKRLTGPLASVLGPNVIAFNGLVIFKMKEIGLAFPYHQDLWYFKRGSDIKQSCGIWMALDDSDEENGCLWVVPGSHRGPIYEHAEPEGAFQQKEFKEVVEARDMNERPVPMKSGSCLFFSGGLLHRSGPNLSDRDRSCYVMHNTSADTLFGSREGSLEYRATMRTLGDRDPQFRDG
jgi:ectoine hydroxylase-related dioxygenase (phytanoyl-CoA dioxygenase family)